MQCVECIDLGIPEYLCSHGKPTNVPFIEDEVIFRRHEDKLEGDFTKLDLKIVERIFKLQNDSYNRSSLSEPLDVLLDEFGNARHNNGIFSIKISSIHTAKPFIINGGIRECVIQVQFVPKDCNYAHCELWCFVDGNRILDGKPPKSAKLHFRQYLLGLISIVRDPLSDEDLDKAG